MKSTKNKLLSSIATLCVCFAMLIGSTYAWFTDSASTGVNKIQAGNLDIQLLDERGNSIEGQTLNFKKADSAPANEAILWEPGCTYELPAFVVKNNGNLALKYKIVISGIKGDAKLNEAIEWTMVENGNQLAIDNTTEYDLVAGVATNPIKITGHMKEDAGNEYQGLSIDGIAITVYARQLNSESDSFGKDYDAGATYPIAVIPEIKETMNAVTDESGNVTSYSYANSDNTVKVNYTPNENTTLTERPKVVMKPTSTSAGNVTINASSKDAIAYDISLVGSNNETVMQNTGTSKFTITVGKNLSNVVVYHNNDSFTEVSTLEAVGVSKYYYDKNAGTVTFATDSYSPYTIVFDAPVASVNGVKFYNLQDAINAAKADDTITLLKDVEIGEQINLPTNVTLDGRYHVIKANNESWSPDNGSKMLLLIGSSDIVKNITLDSNYQACGVQAYAASGVNLENVTLINSKNAGLLINASQVTVSGKLAMSGNKWSGNDANYINLGWGSGVTAAKAILTFEQNASVEGVSMVWTDADDLSHAGVAQDSWGERFAVNGVFVPSKANGGIAFVEPVAKIGENFYNSLNDAISNAVPVSGKTVTINVLKDVTLDSGIANEGDKSRNITFIGNGSQTVDVAKNAPAAEGAKHLNYQRGSIFTFENLTIENGIDTYDGIVCDELTYKNCTIKGVTTLYGKATFINCTFENTMANQYSIWTWGGTDVTFEGCTFNTNGKAILLFGEEKTTNLTVNNCVFNDRNNGAAGKAAIEIGEANYGKHNNFTVVINGSSVETGFANGQNTDSKLWANKNSMDATHLTVIIDGTKVH